MPDLTIQDYQKGDTLNYEKPTPNVLELHIEKAKYWAFCTDYIDKHQADVDYCESWTDDAAEQLKVAIDREILGSIYPNAHALNQGATAGAVSQDINLGATGAPVAIDKTNVLDFIVDLGITLDEQNIPNDRWLVLPVWMCGMIKKSDL